MKRCVLLLMIFITLTGHGFAQTDTTAINSIRKFQDELNAEYRDPAKSPLEPEYIKKFEGLPFFDIDLKYRVNAELILTDQEPYVKMMTSNNRPRNFRQYGILKFMIDGTEFKMPVYQSQQLIGTVEYANYLFFPFTDLTNGKASYSAGRYIDLEIPANGNILTIDFNRAYNPLCAYSNRYSCPVVPAKNHMDIEIKAGVKYQGKY